MSGRKEAPRTEPAHSILYEPEKLTPPAEVPDLDALLREVTPALKKPFNARQVRAFETSFNQPVSLIWGPPGTGKTTVLAGIIVGALVHAEATGTPVRICVGASNYNALDNVLRDAVALYERYVEHKRKEWTARFVRVRSDHASVPLDGRLEDVPRSSAAGLELAQELGAPKTSLVVGGMWMQMGKLCERGNDEEKLTAPWFDLLIIDESSQVDVSSAAAYLLLLAQGARVVLAGDDRQLGPVYGFEMREHRDGLFDCIYSYMKLTHGLEPVVLNENYRNNDEIADWPRVRFYEDDLQAMFPKRRLDISVPKTEGKAPAGWNESLPWTEEYSRILSPDQPIIVITYGAGSYTLSNAFEAQTAAAIARLYHLALEATGDVDEKDFWEQKLGIVSPHRAQIASIRNKLIDAAGFKRQPAPIVDTVDRFQGLERDLIIASYTVADPDFVGKEDAFILSPRRFNVTLTRARSKFIMLVSEAIVQHLPADMEVATDAAHIQLFVESYCSNVRKIQLPFVDEGGTVIPVVCSMRTPAL
ncbi:MAG TPA: ATP-binding protein [Pyrinomonadaceae bacterium]